MNKMNIFMVVSLVALCSNLTLAAEKEKTVAFGCLGATDFEVSYFDSKSHTSSVKVYYRDTNEAEAHVFRNCLLGWSNNAVIIDVSCQDMSAGRAFQLSIEDSLYVTMSHFYLLDGAWEKQMDTSERPTCDFL